MPLAVAAVAYHPAHPQKDMGMVRAVTAKWKRTVVHWQGAGVSLELRHWQGQGAPVDSEAPRCFTPLVAPANITIQVSIAVPMAR